MPRIIRNEDVAVTYDKESGKIKVVGSSFEAEVVISKMQMANVYTGHEGYGKAKIKVTTG